MKASIISVILLLVSIQILNGQCYCEDCPEDIIANVNTLATLNVSNASNATLGQNGQSVVNVGVLFTHAAAQELSLKLVAPDGSFVDLTIGEGLDFGDNNNFDIDFVQCSDVAVPDCTNNTTWNSLDEWNQGPYSGSYYPESGCLEDLTGPVNGEWRLEMFDVFSIEDGELFCFDITFADDTGINCMNNDCGAIFCEAQGGLSQEPAVVNAPQGDPALIFDITINYQDCEVPAPNPEYIIVYLTFDVATGLLVAVQEDIDLTLLDEGTYLVQAISVLASDLGVIQGLDPGTTTIITVISLVNGTTICVDYTLVSTVVNIDDCFIDFTGMLNFSSIQAPEGDESFNTSWFYTWSPAAPDPAVWTEVWVVYDANTSVLIGYFDDPDFTSLPAGEYSVRVLTYHINDEPLLPAINGINTITTITSDIAADVYCAQLFGLNTLIVEEICDLDVNATLEMENITAPQNDPALDPDWDITYIGAPPDPSEYQLYFVVVDLNTDDLVAYYTDDDFTLLLVGEYYVVALWVDLDDLQLLPSVSGTNTFADLALLIVNDDICAQYFGYNELYITAPCLANAGEYPSTPSEACEGSLDLDLGWEDNTTYTPGTEPNPSLYTLEFIISQNNVILDIVAETDLTGYAVGIYQICGFSYLNSDAPLIPQPNGVLSVDDLYTGIQNEDFCGDIHTDCAIIEILPPTIPDFTGPLTVCAGEVIEYVVNDFSGNNFDYLFTINQGGFDQFIIDENGTLEVIWASGPGNICVENIVETCSEQVCLTIDVLPQATFTINGPTEVCPGEEVTYTFDLPPVSPQFASTSVIGGSIITEAQGSITILWDDTNTGSITSEYLGGNCPSEVIILNVTKIEDLVFPTVSLPTESCFGSGVAIPDLNANDFVDWNWSATNADILIANGFVNFTWQSIGNAEICLEVENECEVEIQCFDVDVLPTPQPFIDPFLEFCSLTFILDATPDFGNSWLWTSPGGGSITYSDQTNFTTSVTVPGPGTYTFILQEFSNPCGGTVETTVEITDGLDTSSPQYICDNQGNYIVSFTVLTGTAPYTVNGDQITGSLFTSGPINSGGTSTFNVSDSDGCIVEVVGSFTCPCTSDAGTMPSNVLTSCISDNNPITVVSNGDADPDFDDVGVYILHTASGNGLGVVLALSDSGIFGFDVTTMVAGQTYYVSYVVGNEDNGTVDLLDPCLAVSFGQPIIFFDDPVVDAGDDANVCGLEYNLSATAPTIGGVWSVVDFPVGASTNLEFITGETFVTVDMPGSYTFSLEIVENGCAGSAEVMLTFIENPSATSIFTSCDSDNYTVEFGIQGGDAPYAVNGSQISGNQFISGLIPSGDIYSFTITDANGCESGQFTGTKLCDCETFAGTVDDDLISICSIDGTLISGSISNGDTILDSDDAGVYILHTGSSNILGTVIAENDTPDFNYDSSFGTDLTLYLSYVVGDSLGASVDFTDPCLSVSVGQPIEISSIRKTDAGDYIPSCDYTINLAADDQGTSGMWSVIAAPDDAVVSFSNMADASSDLEVDMPGDYALAWLPSGDDCVLGDSTMITFDPIFRVIDTYETCSDDLSSFEVNVDFEGGVAPYFVDGQQVTSTYISESFPSGSIFSLVISDSRGCELVVDGLYECECDNQAGTMESVALIACFTDTIVATYNNDATPTGTDVEYFVVHDSNTDTLGNIISIYNTNEIYYNVDFILGQTYYVSHVLGNSVLNMLDTNSPCLKVSIGQPIIFRDFIEISAGDDAIVCGLTAELFGQGSPEFNYSWTVISGPFGAMVEFPALGVWGSVVVDRVGVYTLEALADNGLCPIRDTVQIEFVDPFIFEDLSVNCMVDGYIVSWTFQGGVEPYFVNGEVVIGNTYESALIPLEADYSFTMSDASICNDNIIIGSDICECESDAGTMSSSPLVVCETETIIPDELSFGNYNLDDNDAAEFVVHTSPDETLGDVLAVFGFNSFDPITFDELIFDYNTTYYISLVVGNVSGSSVDYSDPCTSLSLGTPFSWVPEKSVFLDGGGEGCTGELIAIEVESTGDLPFEIVLSSSNNGTTTYLIENSPQTIFMEIVQSESIELIDILGTDCKDVSSPMVDIILIENEVIETVTEVIFCIDDLMDGQLELRTLITIGDDTGAWYLDGIAMPDILDFTSFDLGQYVIEYRVNGICSEQNAFVALSYEACDEPCPTFTFIQEDASCFGVDDGEIRLFANEIEVDTDFDIVINGEAISSYPISNLSAGSYVVAISNQDLCEASFSIDITEPAAVSVSLGEDMQAEINDPVTIEAITNLLDENIDGVTWSSLQGIFDETNLALTTTFENDDVISISIIDENGCSGMDDIMVRVDLAEVFIPNVFNPNSRTGNNIFRITSNVGTAMINQFQIFDRWGNQVFAVANINPSDPMASWDGRNNDAAVLAGVYVYYLELQVGEEIIQKLGDITVLR